MMSASDALFPSCRLSSLPDRVFKAEWALSEELVLAGIAAFASQPAKLNASKAAITATIIISVDFIK